MGAALKEAWEETGIVQGPCFPPAPAQEIPACPLAQILHQGVVEI